VAIARDGLTPDRIMTPQAFENALRVVLAVGGSTNAVVHLAAMAGRLGIRIDMDGFDRIGRETPVLVDLKPTGQYYMEDLYKAGGLAMVLRELRPMLHLDCMTVTGRTLGEEIDAAPPAWTQTVVQPINRPIHSGGAMAVLRGNLAPDGALIKQAAATPALLQHTGRAVVFENLFDLADRIDAPDLDVRPEDILVLRNAGPKGAPGMPEAGYLPIPRKLAREGVKDMVRLSDARMSGTAFGTIVLHVTPEAAAGGTLALVHTGDRIKLDTEGRRLELLVDDAELSERRRSWNGPQVREEDARGYRKLYLDTVNQATEGCDFDFLTVPVRAAAPVVR
jgi:dihydroxy-acid dehydratase